MLKLLILLILISIPVLYTEYRIRHNIANDDLPYKYRYNEMFANKKKSEVLVLGTSHGAHGIIPGALKLNGHTTYNFCFNGASPSFNYELYKNIISNYYTKPKLIIYEVNTIMFDNKILNRNMERDYMYMPVTKAFEHKWKYYTSIMMPYDFLQITHEDDVFRALKRSFKNKRSDNILLQFYDNGFVPFESEFKADGRVTEVINNRIEMEMFTKLIQLIKSQNIELVFVDVPVCTTEFKYNNNANKNNSLIKSFADKSSISFLDYNGSLRSPLNDDKRFFSDPGHLNYLGARTFSEKLSSDINKLKLSK